MQALVDLWHWLTGTVFAAQSAPPRLLLLGTGVLALAVVVPRQVWRTARHTITIAHEGGHGLAALLTGRRLTGIRLHSDTSGLTLSSGRARGPGMALTLLAGYLTPSLLGLGGAELLAHGRIRLLLWAALVLLPAMLVMIRNAFGVLSVTITGAVVFAVSWFASAQVQAAFAYLGVWFLLIGGVRPVFELQRSRRGHRATDSDADQLGRLTGVAAVLWVGLFLVLNLAAALAGACLLLRGAGVDAPALLSSWLSRSP